VARLYANENFPLPVVEELRRLGHDVLTSYESGQAGKAISDPDVLALSIREERILITLNRKHFVRLHQLRPQHPGIIACTFDPNFSALAQRIHAALAAKILNDTLVRVNRPQ
jgi:hypothetical protein